MPRNASAGFDTLAYHHRRLRPEAYRRDHRNVGLRGASLRALKGVSVRPQHMELDSMAGCIMQLGRSGQVHRPGIGHGLGVYPD